MMSADFRSERYELRPLVVRYGVAESKLGQEIVVRLLLGGHAGRRFGAAAGRGLGLEVEQRLVECVPIVLVALDQRLQLLAQLP